MQEQFVFSPTFAESYFGVRAAATVLWANVILLSVAIEHFLQPRDLARSSITTWKPDPLPKPGMGDGGTTAKVASLCDASAPSS
jgi:hypothetical protein